LNNNFTISNRLNNTIGTFGLIYFGNYEYKRKITIYDEYMRVDLQETDGYKFVECVKDLISFYTESITVFDTGKNCECCENKLDIAMNSESFKTIYRF
jgi:DNA phosphorothioation-dependent restriction protein DptH